MNIFSDYGFQMARTLDLAKRTAILAAAKSILIKDGYTAAKMSDIAAEAGVAPGTLYLYFENKEALASAIGEEFFIRFIEKFESIFRDMNDPDGIETLVDWASQIADEDKALLTMVKERTPDAKYKVDRRKQFVSKSAEALSDLMSRGVIRKYDDPATLTDLLLAIMRRLIMSRALFGDEDTEELRAGAISMLQHALFDDISLAANRLVKSKRN